MKNISKLLANSWRFRYIADTLIFDFGEIATICGSRISSAEVWIKVCNPHSLNKKAGPDMNPAFLFPS